MKVNIPAAPALVKPSDLRPPLAKPSDFLPTAAPAAPQGVPTRASASADMAPRQSVLPQPAPQGPGGPGGPGRPGPDLSALSKDVGNDATAKAKGDADQSMKNMAEMNAISMRFQVEMGNMQMQKGMVEGLAKMTKDMGVKVGQLAG